MESISLAFPMFIPSCNRVRRFKPPHPSIRLRQLSSLNEMDTNNWRPTQGAEPTIDTSDWRAQLPPESRHRIANKIMDTLKRHIPVSGQEGLHELWKIAQRFEEKIYTAATSQSDYLRKISLKMLTMETKSQASSMPSNPVANSNKPPDSGLGMQSQVHNPGQSNPINLANQAQSRQQLLSQNIQNNITPSGVPSSAGIAPGLTPGYVGQTPIQNMVPQQNISGQNSVGNTIGSDFKVGGNDKKGKKLELRKSGKPRFKKGGKQDKGPNKKIFKGVQKQVDPK